MPKDEHASRKRSLNNNNKFANTCSLCQWHLLNYTWPFQNYDAYFAGPHFIGEENRRRPTMRLLPPATSFIVSQVCLNRFRANIDGFGRQSCHWKIKWTHPKKPTCTVPTFHPATSQGEYWCLFLEAPSHCSKRKSNHSKTVRALTGISLIILMILMIWNCQSRNALLFQLCQVVLSLNHQVN